MAAREEELAALHARKHQIQETSYDVKENFMSLQNHLEGVESLFNVGCIPFAEVWYKCHRSK